MNGSNTILQNFSRAVLALAVCILTLTPTFALANGGRAAPAGSRTETPREPGAELKNTRIEYNVVEAGRKGMRIRLDFEVTGLKGVDLKIVARVQKDNDEFVKSKSSYANAEGELETSFSMNPGYPTTVYEDAAMFLPYDEITLGKGVWDLKLDIDLSYEDGELIKHLGYRDFRFNAPDSAGDVPEKIEVSGVVNEVWIEHNVTDKKRRGMKIHVDFEVTGLKGVDSRLTARIQRDNGEYLAGNAAFTNAEGELELFYDLRPGYDTTVYKDAVLFVPYDEVILRKGVWKLKLDIDLRYKNGELIRHLEFHEFEMTK